MSTRTVQNKKNSLKLIHFLLTNTKTVFVVCVIFDVTCKKYYIVIIVFTYSPCAIHISKYKNK